MVCLYFIGYFIFGSGIGGIGWRSKIGSFFCSLIRFLELGWSWSGSAIGGKTRTRRQSGCVAREWPGRSEHRSDERPERSDPVVVHMGWATLVNISWLPLRLFGAF